MNLIEDIVSQGHGALDADYVCIHETANPGATARNHRDLWSRDDEYAVHYTADWTGDVYHCVPDDCLCWQVGNGNAHVIGIELCHAESQDDFDAVWRTGVEWARWILAAHGWGTDRLISHDMARQMWGGTDHTDPIGYFGEFGKTWDDFVADVASAESEDDVTYQDKQDIAQMVWEYMYQGHDETLGAGQYGNGYNVLRAIYDNTTPNKPWEYIYPGDKCLGEGTESNGYNVLRVVLEDVKALQNSVEQLSKMVAELNGKVA